MSNYPCPYCNKEFKNKSECMSHIRASAGEHGPKYSFPKDFTKDLLQPTGLDRPSPQSATNQLNQLVEPTNQPTNEPTNEIVENNLQKVQKVDPPKEKPVTRWVCPDCGSGKEDWVRINEAEELGYNVTPEMKNYDFICTICKEVIRVRKGEIST